MQEESKPRTLSRGQLFVTAASIVLPVAFGLLTRFVFAEDSNPLELISVTFCTLTPFALGFLAVFIRRKEEDLNAKTALLAPLIPCATFIVITGLMQWELLFCIALAAPIFLLLAVFGGIFALLVVQWTRTSDTGGMAALVLMVALPYLAAPVEALFAPQERVRTVHSQVTIDAPPEVVWANITNLDPIGPDEQGFAWFHLAGLPRPIEARMACEEVGCVRRGQWEDGLAFDGTITQIEEGVSYWVDLEADTRGVNSRTAPLQDIGGQHFDMVDDGYVIEPLPDGGSVLHLYSTYRVTSRINAYGIPWLDFLMKDIQRFILRVEKVRSEAQA